MILKNKRKRMLKKILGQVLIIFSFSLLFITFIPMFYSSNNLGKIVKEIDADLFFLSDSKNEIAMVFFGYVGCTSVCEPALIEINNIYKKLDNKRISFYFINLLTDIEPSSVDYFVKNINPNFKGIYLEKKEIDKLQKKLNFTFYSTSLSSTPIEHSGFLHIFKKNENGKFLQKFMYTSRPFNVEGITKDLNQFIKDSL